MDVIEVLQKIFQLYIQLLRRLFMLLKINEKIFLLYHREWAVKVVGKVWNKSHLNLYAPMMPLCKTACEARIMDMTATISIKGYELREPICAAASVESNCSGQPVFLYLSKLLRGIV